MTDTPHGRGTATGAYAADDVILSMCNNCNTYCTIKVRVCDAADGPQANEGATALVPRSRAIRTRRSTRSPTRPCLMARGPRRRSLPATAWRARAARPMAA
ncbi:MAG: hypothetical protein ACLVKI_05035 [Gordonibacter urolithinfaciens]